jgi:AraC-like DNA-binding protein
MYGPLRQPVMADDELKSLRVSTDTCQGSRGVEAFLEIWGREILRMEMTPLDGHPLDIDLTLRSLPGFALASGSVSPMRNHHTSALVDNDDLILVAIQRGTGEVSQHGRVAMVAAGQAVLTANGAPGSFTGLTKTHVVNFRLSRNLLRPHVADLDALVARPIPKDDNVLQLLLRYAAVLNDQKELGSAKLRQTIAMHMHDLAALLLGSKGGTGGHGLGLRAARLRAIKDNIHEKIGQHGLSIADIARSQQISESYIRQLLADDGTTFTDFVLAERLARAHRMLTDPRTSELFISAIAYEAGFGDLSYFNRTFRRRYGASPSDVREAAKHDSDR